MNFDKIVRVSFFQSVDLGLRFVFVSYLILLDYSHMGLF